MPEQKTIKRARQAKRQGKAPSTQAGEFVREEIHHVREGKHGARSPEQAIAIGLSKARRAGVELPPPKEGEAKPSTRRSAERDLERGKSTSARRKPSKKRSRATSAALKREGRSAASRAALSSQAKGQARRRRASSKPSTARRGTSQRSSSTGRSRSRRPRAQGSAKAR